MSGFALFFAALAEAAKSFFPVWIQAYYIKMRLGAGVWFVYRGSGGSEIFFYFLKKKVLIF